MIFEPGTVCPNPFDTERLVVVLSDAGKTASSGTVTICPYTVGDGLLVDAETERWHSITPRSGFISWPFHYTVSTGSLSGAIGTVERRAAAASQTAMRARFTSCEEFPSRDLRSHQTKLSPPGS